MILKVLDFMMDVVGGFQYARMLKFFGALIISVGLPCILET